jgi:hypothetical protein
MIKQLARPRIMIFLLGLLLGVPLCYVGAGVGLSYWKENLKHFESGAISCLEALYSMERSYKSENGVYSVDFEELGVPLGAFSHNNKLTWNQGYVYEFSNVLRDASGRVTDFRITARPFIYKMGSRRSFLIDTLGDIHVTTENRPATVRDRNLNTHR